MKCAIFISDVCYGHMVRQRQIIFALLKEIKKLKITVFHKRNLPILKKTFGKKIKYVENFNNIKLFTSINGFDEAKTKKMIKEWEKNSKNFLSKNDEILNTFDFFVSDLVPEISFYGRKKNIPCFSICHFTWDWFFQKLFKKKSRLSNLIADYIKMSTKIYFPPFTFKNILTNYKNKKEVNFITNKIFIKKNKTKRKPSKILIMNNGTGALTHSINKILLSLSKIKNFDFFVSTNNLSKIKKDKIKRIKNVNLINNSLKEMYSYISKVDLVLARGGYNTITECLLLKKPSILSYEKNNPEVNENIKIIKKNNLCSSMTYLDWNKTRFQKKIDSFIKRDYDNVLRNIFKRNFKNNGSLQIAKDIKMELKKYDKNNC